MTPGLVTDEQLAQMRQWYADPVRNLPRKVTADVSALLGHIAARDAEIERLRYVTTRAVDASGRAARTGEQWQKRAGAAEAEAKQLREEVERWKIKADPNINGHYDADRYGEEMASRAARLEEGLRVAADELDEVGENVAAAAARALLAPPAAVAPPLLCPACSKEVAGTTMGSVGGKIYHWACMEPSREQATCETCGGTGVFYYGKHEPKPCPSCGPKPERVTCPTCETRYVPGERHGCATKPEATCDCNPREMAWSGHRRLCPTQQEPKPEARADNARAERLLGGLDEAIRQRDEARRDLKSEQAHVAKLQKHLARATQLLLRAEQPCSECMPLQMERDAMREVVDAARAARLAYAASDPGANRQAEEKWHALGVALARLDGEPA